jgi:hypothetical protein
MIIPHICQATSYIRNWCRRHQTCKESTQHDGLNILSSCYTDEEYAEEEVWRKHGDISPIELGKRSKELRHNLAEYTKLTIDILTRGPKAKPKTKSDSERVVTSVDTPNSAETASNVGEKDEDANEAPMVVKPRRIVVPNFFFRGHYEIFGVSIDFQGTSRSIETYSKVHFLLGGNSLNSHLSDSGDHQGHSRLRGYPTSPQNLSFSLHRQLVAALTGGPDY